MPGKDCSKTPAELYCCPLEKLVSRISPGWKGLAEASEEPSKRAVIPKVKAGVVFMGEALW